MFLVVRTYVVWLWYCLLTQFPTVYCLSFPSLVNHQFWVWIGPWDDLALHLSRWTKSGFRWGWAPVPVKHQLTLWHTLNKDHITMTFICPRTSRWAFFWRTLWILLDCPERSLLSNTKCFLFLKAGHVTPVRFPNSRWPEDFIAKSLTW